LLANATRIRGLCRAPQSIRLRHSTVGRYRLPVVLPWNSPLVQSSAPPMYRPYRLDDPTLPLAISSAVWYFIGGVRESKLNDSLAPLLELGLPSEFCLTHASR
jgi:hypothetical protein